MADNITSTINQERILSVYNVSGSHSDLKSLSKQYPNVLFYTQNNYANNKNGNDAKYGDIYLGGIRYTKFQGIDEQKASVSIDENTITLVYNDETGLISLSLNSSIYGIWLIAAGPNLIPTTYNETIDYVDIIQQNQSNQPRLKYSLTYNNIHTFNGANRFMLYNAGDTISSNKSRVPQVTNKNKDVVDLIFCICTESDKINSFNIQNGSPEYISINGADISPKLINNSDSSLENYIKLLSEQNVGTESSYTYISNKLTNPDPTNLNWTPANFFLCYTRITINDGYMTPANIADSTTSEHISTIPNIKIDSENILKLLKNQPKSSGNTDTYDPNILKYYTDSNDVRHVNLTNVELWPTIHDIVISNNDVTQIQKLPTNSKINIKFNISINIGRDGSKQLDILDFFNYYVKNVITASSTFDSSDSDNYVYRNSNKNKFFFGLTKAYSKVNNTNDNYSNNKHTKWFMALETYSGNYNPETHTDAFDQYTSSYPNQFIYIYDGENYSNTSVFLCIKNLNEFANILNESDSTNKNVSAISLALFSTNNVTKINKADFTLELQTGEIYSGTDDNQSKINDEICLHNIPLIPMKNVSGIYVIDDTTITDAIFDTNYAYPTYHISYNSLANEYKYLDTYHSIYISSYENTNISYNNPNNENKRYIGINDENKLLIFSEYNSYITSNLQYGPLSCSRLIPIVSNIEGYLCITISLESYNIIGAINQIESNITFTDNGNGTYTRVYNAQTIAAYDTMLNNILNYNPNNSWKSCTEDDFNRYLVNPYNTNTNPDKVINPTPFIPTNDNNVVILIAPYPWLSNVNVSIEQLKIVDKDKINSDVTNGTITYVPLSPNYVTKYKSPQGSMFEDYEIIVLHDLSATEEDSIKYVFYKN